MPQGYTSIRFERKAIRVKWDDKPKKYWFIVVDVLSYLFDNPHNFWKQIKSAIATNGEATSNYYISCTYDNETFDIADYQQIVNILKYIPGRVNKKERLVTWLIYPMPSAIQSRVYNALYNKNQTQTDWDNLIKEANNCGVRTETIKDYIDFLKNRKQYQAYINDINNQPLTQDTGNTTNGNNTVSDGKVNFGCIVAIVAIIGLYASVGFIQKYAYTHSDFAWIAAVVFAIISLIGLYIYHRNSQYTDDPKRKNVQFVRTKVKPTKQEKSSPEIEIVSVDGKRKCPLCGERIPITDNKCPFCKQKIVYVKKGNGEIPIQNARNLITSKYHYEREDETGKIIAVAIWTIIGTAAIIFFYLSVFKSC